jgi:hypothetical protein
MVKEKLGDIYSELAITVLFQGCIENLKKGFLELSALLIGLIPLNDERWLNRGVDAVE